MPRPVEYADIGCGFGGLLVKLGEKFPEKVGMFMGGGKWTCLINLVGKRIKALRNENKGRFHNIAVVRTNAMKCIANFFVKVTDVKELHDWQVEHLDAHPVIQAEVDDTLTRCWIQLFERLEEATEKADPCWDLMFNSSEEANKVERNEGSKFGAIYRRISLSEAVSRREKKE
eukprot:260909-Hanusia_phi.AAC.2